MGTYKTALQNEQGFTLIDVAIALMVIGLLVAPIAQMYHVRQKEMQRSTTEAAINNAQAAINQYYFNNDRYPCPADPTKNVNDPDYGVEAVDAGTGNCLGGAPGLTVAAVGANNVLIGAVPFQTLKLTPEETLDAWNNKVNYAVTDILTTPGTYSAGGGAITIDKPVTETSNDVCNGPQVIVNNVHLAIFSNGKSGAGAFDANGNQALACPGNATTDGENCDGDAVFVYPECTASDVAGADFYDDMFLVDNNEFTGAPGKMWDTATDPNNVGFGSIGYIGLGNNDPQAELDVIGNIRAQSNPSDPTKLGQAQASEYCDPTGQDCFDTSLIMGNDPNMQCGSTKAMSGIGSARAKCSDALPNMPKQKCPNGQYLSEITAGGTIVCATP